MTAKVLHPIKLNGEPVEPGAVVEVCDNTFANLVRKGWLEPADAGDSEPDKPHADSRKTSPKLRTR